MGPNLKKKSEIFPSFIWKSPVKNEVKSFSDKSFFPLHFGIVICQMKHPTVSYLTDRFHNLLTFVVHLFKIKTIVWRDRGVFTVYILEQLYISFSYVCIVVVHWFPSWLVWGRNQVYCACCSGWNAHKLV